MTSNSNVDLSCVVAGVTMPSCLMNASGPLCTTIEELQALGMSNSGSIVTKSCTFLERAGNEEPRYTDLPLGGSIQSMGLPNPGYKAYLEMIPKIKAEFGHCKPVIASVAGLSAEDNMVMLKEIGSVMPDIIELNLSCPNLVGKPQVAYDFEATRELLRKYVEVTEIPLGLKLPPFLDSSHHDTMAEIIKSYQPKIRFVTVINSVGSSLAIDVESETALIRPKGGFGGLSGTYVKPIGLGNVRAFRKRLPEAVDVIGVGGVFNGTDAFEYLLAGASAVQVGTCLWREGVGCFARIESELKEVLALKHYNSARDAVDKLKMR